MKFALNRMTFAVIAATTQFTGLACAETQKTPAVMTVAQASLTANEDKAQLRADRAALQREEKQLRADQKMLNSDTKEGRMAAESKDAEKVYQDQMGLRGEKKDIAADIPGSLQFKSDKVALQSDEKQIKADNAKLIADAKEGRMAAESRDAERVYQDQQAIKGEKQDIAADAAKLRTDPKS